MQNKSVDMSTSSVHKVEDWRLPSSRGTQDKVIYKILINHAVFEWRFNEFDQEGTKLSLSR